MRAPRFIAADRIKVAADTGTTKWNAVEYSSSLDSLRSPRGCHEETGFRPIIGTAFSSKHPARPVLLLPLLRCNWPARRHRSNKHRVTFTFASFVSRVQFPFYGIFVPLDNLSTEFLKLILILRSSVAGFSHEIYSYNAYRKMEFS